MTASPSRVLRTAPPLRNAGAPRRRLFVPAWQGLGPEVFGARAHAAPFPFDAPGATYFYRARHAIYHLFRALDFGPRDTILAPDYHSGNELRAMRATGARIRLYRVNRRMEADLEQVEALCRMGARALFVIHYLGFPQPMRDLMGIAREHKTLVVEDCALALLSAGQGRSLGAFGDFSVFCLYKTLPVPNGGLLLQNGAPIGGLEEIRWEGSGLASIAGLTAELLVRRLRGRYPALGAGLSAAKGGVGRLLRRLPPKRVPVGDIGFSLSDVNTRISNLSQRLLPRLDYDAIRARRRANFLSLREQLDGRVALARDHLAPGVCPLFLPILVADKASAARALWREGIEAVLFWNEGDPASASEEGADARFLRAHVLEIPIHQDVSGDQIDGMAERMSGLDLRPPSGAVPSG